MDELRAEHGNNPIKIAQEMNAATTSADAWFAITGRARKNNQQAPMSTGSAPFDPLAQMAPEYPQGGQAPPQRTWMDTLASYQGRAW
jgi:hypothetical protein